MWTRDNGCLYFLPGTHKLATYDNVGIGSNISDLFNRLSAVGGQGRGGRGGEGGRLFIS